MEKKKILIDIQILSSVAEKTGIYRYVYEYVKHLKNILIINNYNFDIDLFTGKNTISINDFDQQTIHSNIYSSDIKIQNTISKFKPSTINFIKEKIFNHIPVLYKLIYFFHLLFSFNRKIDKKIKSQYDLVHLTVSTYFYIFKSFVSKKIVTIFDLTVDKFPHHHEGGTVDMFKRSYRYTKKHSDHIITISHSAKNDFIHYYPYSDKNITPIHLGYDQTKFYPVKDPILLQKIQNKYNISGNYILNLNTLEPRKNVVGCIYAFIRLINELKENDLKLVLIGKMGWKSNEIQKELEKYKNNIIITGFVPDEDLAVLYTDAQFFCYPSHYEGFGLPLLESMACGTPVIYGNNSSMPEIAEGCGLPVDTHNVQDIYEKMKELYLNDQLREDLSMKSLEKALQFSWDKCAKETLDVYKKVLTEQ